MNDAQQPLNALPQGHRLQEYELVRVLGFGGFGMTYLGFDHNLDKAVAIKEYLPSDIAIRTGDNSVAPQASQFQDDFEWGLERFLDEARALARFDHRNIIKVHRFFEAHGTAYIVMEYAEGETLSAFLERKGTLREDELAAILYPLLDGLEVVHGADFLHRDIKPGNIIIRDEDNSPVLLDFGSARQAMGARSRSVTSIITPGYAPIEQYSSRGDQGPWTDIYALGGVCSRALTGEVPDDATDRMRDDPLIPVSERCAGQVSAEFLSAIDWALAVDEGDRPQGIAEWRSRLEGEQVVDSPPIEERQISVTPIERTSTLSGVPQGVIPELERKSKRRGKVLLGVLGVCLLLTGLGGYLWWAKKNHEAEIVRYVAQFEEALGRKDFSMAGIYVDSLRVVDSDAPMLSELEDRLSKARQVSDLLSGAAEDMAADRLTSPTGQNAWEKYQLVLELEPEHGVATAGLDSIIARYVVKFESALEDKDFTMADECMAQIRVVDSNAPMLSELEGRLSASRQTEKRRQEQAALEKERRRQEQRVGGKFKDCEECPQMVVVSSGLFTMGSPSWEAGRHDNEGPRHVVHIDYKLAVGVYEVTFSEWDACVAAGGCGEYIPDDKGLGRGNRPVTYVSWDDARSYVRWLSDRTGQSYRLLSESEWEYVARAGSVTAYSWGDDIGHNRANCYGCGSQWDDEEKAGPVGSFSANSWGVHDMHGNICEWVQDCYADSYTDTPTDGSARNFVFVRHYLS